MSRRLIARSRKFRPTCGPWLCGELEPQEGNLPRGSFEMGVAYEMTQDGRLGRAHGRSVERQVAALQAAAQEQEWIEEESDRPLPEEVARDLQASYQDSVAQQAAEMAADANRADQITDAVIEEQKPVELFVRRGSRHYVPIDKARLRAAEAVFIREADGGYQSIGICDNKGSPPSPPIIIT